MIDNGQGKHRFAPVANGVHANQQGPDELVRQAFRSVVVTADSSLRRIDRLRQMHLEAGGQRLRDVFGTRVRRQRDRRHPADLIGRQRTDRSQQGVAILLRHADIRDEHIRMGALQACTCFGRRARRHDIGAGVLENRAKDVARVRIVVDDQNARAAE